MPDYQTELLFVHGVQKTGTSTLVGMLNTHPGILVLYETRMDRSAITKYGNQLLAHLPETRKFFRDTPNIGEPYLGFAQYLSEQDPRYQYRYIGDKIISLNPAETQPTLPHKTIYTMRDARTWLCKEQIVKYFRTDLDIVAPAVDYLRYIIQSLQFSGSLLLRMEDIVLNNAQVLDKLAEYLEIDLKTHAESWWEKIGQYEENDPKNYVQWYLGHPSSKTEPKILDTSSDLKPHPFWQEYLPLFDRYFHFDSSGADLSKSALDNDLRKLESLLDHSPLPIDQCYRNIDTRRLAPQSDSPSQKPLVRFLKTLAKKLLS